MWRAINLSVLVTVACAAFAAPPALAASKAKTAAPAGSPAAWFTNDDYPAAARLARQQGRVQVELSIDAQGKIVACRVAESSGSAALDDTTCRLVRERGSFTPALDAKGRAVASTYKLSTRWTLSDQRTPVALRLPFRAATDIGIDPTGKVVTCRDDMPVEATALDVFRCSSLQMMAPSFGMYVRGPNAGPAMVNATIESSFSADGDPSPKMAFDGPNRVVRSLTVMHFIVGPSGAIEQCKVLVPTPQPGYPNACDNPPGPYLPSDAGRNVTMTIAISIAAVQ